MKRIIRSIDKKHIYIVMICVGLAVIITIVLGWRRQERKVYLGIGDGGLLSSTICQPPCLLDIIIGTTTKEEVINILDKHNFIDHCTVKNGITCGTTLVIDFENDVVNIIRYTPETRITLGEIIRVRGEPSAFQVTEDAVTAPLYVTAIVFFDRINTMIILPSQEGQIYHIDKDIIAEAILYLSEKEYLAIRENEAAWQGYGDYLENIW